MKTSTLIITGLLAVSLGACGATTGSIAKTMAKKAAVNSVATKVMPTAAPAAASASVSTPSAMKASSLNGSSECAAIKTEMAEVDGIIADSNKILGGAGRTGLAGQVAATGASQAAIRSGALGSIAKVPFGGLFAKSALDSMANAGRKKAEQAQSDLQNANLRKASLSGLYAGKNCAS